MGRPAGFSPYDFIFVTCNNSDIAKQAQWPRARKYKLHNRKVRSRLTTFSQLDFTRTSVFMIRITLNDQKLCSQSFVRAFLKHF